MITLQCPTCGQRLTVSPSAPARLRCPNCLGQIDNPRIAQGALPPPPPPLPLPVIPLDDQVQRDSRFGVIGIVVVGVLAFIGMAMSFTQVAGQNNAALTIIIGLAIAMVVCVIIALMRMKTASGERAPAPARAPAVEGVSYLGQAIGGIVLGIVVAAGLCIASRGGELLLAGILAPAVVGIVIVCTISKLRGFGIGMILAVPAAFLLLIGLCFAALAGPSFHI